MHDRTYADDRPGHFDRFLQRAEEFFRTRTSDHWLMFIGGLVIGLIVG